MAIAKSQKEEETMPLCWEEEKMMKNSIKKSRKELELILSMSTARVSMLLLQLIQFLHLVL